MALQPKDNVAIVGPSSFSPSSWYYSELAAVHKKLLELSERMVSYPNGLLLEITQSQHLVELLE